MTIIKYHLYSYTIMVRTRSQLENLSKEELMNLLVLKTIIFPLGKCQRWTQEP